MFSSKSYTVIKNAIFQDKTLPLKAMGLYALILSLPQNWNFSMKGLAALNSDGISAIRSSIKLLENTGLLEIISEKSKVGERGSNKYLLSSFECNTYTMVNNTIFKNKKLSLKAKGLFCLLNSLPKDNWRFTVIGLTKICKDGKESITKAIKELEEHRYLSRERNRDNLGKYTNSTYTLSSHHSSGQAALVNTVPECKTCDDNNEPISVNPMPEDPTATCPMAGNQTQYNNNIFITKKFNTNRSLDQKDFSFSDIKNTFKQKIEHYILAERYSSDIEMINAIVDIVAETYLSRTNTYFINNCCFSKDDVLSQFETLGFEQIEYMIETIKKRQQNTPVYNFKKYLLTCLFNANTQYNLYLATMISA